MGLTLKESWTLDEIAMFVLLSPAIPSPELVKQFFFENVKNS